MRKLLVIAGILLFLLLPGCIHRETADTCAAKQADQRNRCYSDAAFAYAAIDKNPGMAATMCDNIPSSTARSVFTGSMRDRCFIEIARVMESPALCGAIEFSINRDLCLEKATPRQNATFCGFSPVIFIVFLLALFARGKN